MTIIVITLFHSCHLNTDINHPFLRSPQMAFPDVPCKTGGAETSGGESEEDGMVFILSSLGSGFFVVVVFFMRSVSFCMK